jgi:hypothetical protein
MEKTFSQLTTDEQQRAISMILILKNQFCYPEGPVWNSISDINYSIINMGYNPDWHFTFNDDENGLSVLMK